MTDTGIIALLLIITNVIVSYKGFTSQSFINKYEFEVDRIMVDKEYYRVVTSGFLHVSWTHLIFNMFSLYVFSAPVESALGGLRFTVIYFASLIGGNLFSLFVHRNHGDYTSVGASGAVCGIIFASIALFPGMHIGFFMLPFSMPGWLYGILYVLYSVYGIRSGKNNIGHEAHLGGALVGMVIASLMVPSALSDNYVTILLIAIPTAAFIYFIITKPHLLLVDNLYAKKHKHHYSVDHQYNEEKSYRQKEIDNILDKISRNGMSSLSRREKEKLKEYSRSVQ